MRSIGDEAVAAADRRVLLIEDGFLKDRGGKPVHGVELFRLMLIRELAGAGVGVVAPASSGWRGSLLSEGGVGREAGVRFVFGRALPSVARGVWAGARTARERAGVVLIGNPRRGLMPGARLAFALHGGARRLVFAHRPLRGGEERWLRGSGCGVVAVSEHVAGGYRGLVGRGGVEWVRVMYGLPNAELFRPAAEGCRRSDRDGVTRFCLLGRLPNVSKGHERAIAAFRGLPAAVRARCELHLASFVDEASAAAVGGEEGVVAHGWLSPEGVAGLLRKMDVLLAISSNETFSQAIVQGMLSGLAVIATPLDVYVEKLDAGGGVVVSGVDETIAAMSRLASMAPRERRAMGLAGERTARARYVWDTRRFVREVLFPAG